MIGEAMHRRSFFILLGTSAAASAWPLTARAQQDGRVRRIGVLLPFASSDPGGRADLAAFSRGLSELGWIDGRNVKIEVRWTGGSPERARALAKEIVGFEPDVILTNGTPATSAIQQESQTIPI